MKGFESEMVRDLKDFLRLYIRERRFFG